jgi:hypothetical protein
MSSFVNNTGTNYTLFYNVLDYFKTIMENHPSIASATQGDIFEIDDKEFQKYPLANILITNATFADSTTIYRCQLTVADKIKLKNNDSQGVYNKQTISYLGTDDTVDIHANTLAILNDLLSYTQYVPTNFDINGDIDCEAFKDRFDNGLGGWVATFDLTTHNDRPRCLFNLLDVPTTTTTTSTSTTTQPTTTTTSTSTTTAPTTTTTTTEPTTTTTSTSSTTTTTEPTTTTTTTTEPTTTTTTSTSTTTTTTEPTTTTTTTEPTTTTTTSTSTTSTTTEPTTTTTTSTSTTSTTTEPTTTTTTSTTTTTAPPTTTTTTTTLPPGTWSYRNDAFSSSLVFATPGNLVTDLGMTYAWSDVSANIRGTGTNLAVLTGNIQTSSLNNFASDGYTISTLVSGSGSLRKSDDTQFEFGSSSFTIETYVNGGDIVPARMIFSDYLIYNVSQTQLAFQILPPAVGSLQTPRSLRVLIGIGGAGEIIIMSNPLTWNVNQWYHIALVRNGNILKLYRDGIELTETVLAISLNATNQDKFIMGYYNTGDNNTTASVAIQDYRIYNGAAKYTASFTPPPSMIYEN